MTDRYRDALPAIAARTPLISRLITKAADRHGRKNR